MAQNATAPTAAPVTATQPPSSAGWGGCVDPNKGYLPVTIGEPTTICLNVANGANWSESVTYMRLNFQPIADQYSRFLVPKSFQELTAQSGSLSSIYGGKNITVFAAAQSSLSFQKLYYDVTEQQVYPFLTAVIDVAEGVVQGIVWDDASIFCGSKEQNPNTLDFAGVAGSSKQFGQPVDGCFVPLVDCVANTKNSTGCDLLLYVVWTGTDSKKRPFLSSSYRFSAFPPQDWADRITSNLPDIPDIPEMPDIPDVNPLN